jgi:hypothetical protein
MKAKRNIWNIRTPCTTYILVHFQGIESEILSLVNAAEVFR